MFYYQYSKKAGYGNLIPSFVASFIFASIVAILALSLDWEGSLSCREEVVFRVQDDFCTFTGMSLYFAFMAANSWTCGICLQLYLTVVVGVSKVKMRKIVKAIWFTCLIFPLLSIVVLYFFDAFGASISIPFGICFVINKSVNEYRQRFGWIYPSLATSGIAFFLMSAIIYKVARTVLHKDTPEALKELDPKRASEEEIRNSRLRFQQEQEQRRMKNAWKKMLWLNQKTLSFIFVFVICNSIAYIVLIKMYEVDYDEASETTADYVNCLLLQGLLTTTPYDARHAPKEFCGEPDEDIQIWSQFYYALLWLQLMGVPPLFVFGTKGRLKKMMEKAVDGLKAKTKNVKNLLIKLDEARTPPPSNDDQTSSTPSTGRQYLVRDIMANDIAMLPIVGDVYVESIYLYRRIKLLFGYTVIQPDQDTLLVFSSFSFICYSLCNEMLGGG